MFGPFARISVGFFRRQVGVFEQIGLDNVVRVGGFAARVKHPEHIISAIPVLNDDFDQNNTIANGLSELALGFWRHIPHRFDEIIPIARHAPLALAIIGLNIICQRRAAGLDRFAQIRAINMVQ